MSKILIVSAVFPPEPIVSAQISGSLAVGLAKQQDVTVLCPKPTRPFGCQFSGEEQSANYKLIRVNSYTCPIYSLIGRFRESYSFGKQCCKFIKNNHDKIDFIYANTWPLFAQLLTVKTAIKYRIPIVLHIQDIYPESLSNKMPVVEKLINFFLVPLDKYILKNITHIIAISEKMKSYLAVTRKLNLTKIDVVHNWQDETAFIQYNQTINKQVREKKPFVFMYLGNIGPVAGVDLLIDAFSEANLQNSKLIIAGSGSMKEQLQKKCATLNLDTIEFWSVPDGKVPEVQAQADVLLLPIKKGAAQSSIPSKLAAYMFSEKSIISCVDKNSDIAHAIIESDCGWVLESENISELANKMKEVTALLPKELEEKGENGFNYAMQHFSKKENLNKLIYHIEELL